MLIHWLKWDFRIHRVQWVIFLLLEFLAYFLESGMERFEIMVALAIIYSVLPAAKLFGTRGRSQHVMSRSYLLSLPEPRFRTYLTLILRMQIFAIPQMILLFVLPGSGLLRKSPGLEVWLHPVYFRLILLPGMIWLVAFQLRTQLAQERISTYLKVTERFFAWAIQISGSIAEFLLVLLLAALTVGGWMFSPIPQWLALVLFLGAMAGRVWFSFLSWRRI